MDEPLKAGLEQVQDYALKNFTPEICDCLTNCYRICRNLLALEPANQLFLHRSRLVEKTSCVLRYVASRDTAERTDSLLVLLRCGVQFYGNYCSGNTQNQIHVWNSHCDVLR